MMPSVLSLQVGRIAPLGPQGVPSGFVKRTVIGSVVANPLGLDGDQQADLSVHGGPDKAVYFYPSEHYARWINDVPRHAETLIAGAFGENVTTVGLDEQSVAIGDVLAIGSTQMQVTQPRQPCFKLGLHFKDNALGRIMMKTGRSGWYVRVLHAGKLTAGDTIQVVERPSPQWSIARFNQFILNRGASADELKELSQLPGLAEGWKRQLLNAL